MPQWFYVVGEQRQGPFEQNEFDGLVANGTIQDETLVWHDGMAEWQPLSAVRTEAAAAPVGGDVGATVVCVECDQSFPKDEVIQFRGQSICAACKPNFMAKVTQGVSTSSGALDYAGFWIRAGAKIIDGIVVAIPTYAAMYAFLGALIVDPATVQGSAYWVINILSYVGGLLYTWLLTWKYGATLGKMACGLKVVTADGEPIGIWRSLARVPAEYISAIVLCLGYVIAGFDSEKRSLHDFICSTRVVYK